MSPRAYIAWEQGKRSSWTRFYVERLLERRINISADWLLCGRLPMHLEDDREAA